MVDLELVSLVERVHALPYGRPRDRTVEGMWREGRGTCSTKHLYLARELAHRCTAEARIISQVPIPTTRSASSSAYIASPRCASRSSRRWPPTTRTLGASLAQQLAKPRTQVALAERGFELREQALDLANR